jgi:hypothetical protein
MNFTVAGMILAGLAMAANFCNLSSGTSTMPMLGSMVQNAKLLAAAWRVFTSALNNVLLPTFGSPTIPIESEIVTPYFHEIVIYSLF